ncbi:MAG: hypothetical protein ACYC1L_18760 [Alphaproteobacteria bacterium]
MAKAKKTRKAKAVAPTAPSGAQPPIKKPGLVVNWLKGDPVERPDSDDQRGMRM